MLRRSLRYEEPGGRYWQLKGLRYHTKVGYHGRDRGDCRMIQPPPKRRDQAASVPRSMIGRFHELGP
jgi:hypothetical protein